MAKSKFAFTFEVQVTLDDEDASKVTKALENTAKEFGSDVNVDETNVEEIEPEPDDE